MARITQTEYNRILADDSGGGHDRNYITRGETRLVVEFLHQSQDITVDALPQMRAVPIDSLEHGDTVRVLGHTVLNDHAGVTYIWDANSTDADNLGTIIIPDETPVEGRWLMQLPMSWADARWWGVFVSNTGDISDELDRATQQAGAPGIYLVGYDTTIDQDDTYDYRLSRPFAPWYGVLGSNYNLCTFVRDSGFSGSMMLDYEACKKQALEFGEWIIIDRNLKVWEYMFLAQLYFTGEYGI